MVRYRSLMERTKRNRVKHRACSDSGEGVGAANPTLYTVGALLFIVSELYTAHLITLLLR